MWQRSWGAAWAVRDVSVYLGFYAPGFRPEGGLSREAWVKQREQRINKAADIRLEIRDPVVKEEGDDRATVSFRQIYASGAFSDVTDKTREWQRIEGKWMIVRETARSVPPGQ